MSHNAMTCLHIPARPLPPSPCKYRPTENRGRRECRMLDAPVASYAKVESIRVSHHRFAETFRHSLRDGFNGFLRALSGDRAFLSPSPADYSTDLTPASRRQDHTTSPSAIIATRQLATPHPSHPVPNVRDDREAPLLRDGMARNMDLIWVKREEQYFFE